MLKDYQTQDMSISAPVVAASIIREGEVALSLGAHTLMHVPLVN
jgi:hypothetical protein